MKRLFEELIKNMDEGKKTVLATIVASSGSVPRGMGSKMLVKADGTIVGTVGGGAVEYRAMQIAAEAIQNESSMVQGFSLTRNQVADIGMVCGGDVVIYFQYMDPEDEELKAFCRKVAAALGENQDSWLVMDITDETCWQMGLYKEDGSCAGMDIPAELMEQLDSSKARQFEWNGRKFYGEPLVQAGTVYIFGGGHVAQELVPVLAHLGFRCVVMDDRKDFANPEIFPQAAETIVGDMERISDYITIKKNDYVCVMTRGHQFDYYVQRQVLKIKPRYIGIMGSRNKIKVVTEKLLGDGFTLEEIQSCHMPIGTAIKAVTPAEIAISIAGELIMERAAT